MKTVAAIYTAFSIIEPTKALFAEIVPGHRLVSIYDDSLIPDVVAAGNTMTDDVRRRFLAYCRAAEDMGADLILSTCSSLGDIVGQAQPFIKIPLLRIDEAIARQAVDRADSIAVLATADTPLGPTRRLLGSVAGQIGKKITIVEGLAKGAQQALNAGQPEVHDEILLNAALAVAGKAEVIILAQVSMIRMQEEIAKATGKPVLSSLRPGLIALRNVLEEK